MVLLLFRALLGAQMIWHRNWRRRSASKSPASPMVPVPACCSEARTVLRLTSAYVTEFASTCQDLFCLRVADCDGRHVLRFPQWAQGSRNRRPRLDFPAISPIVVLRDGEWPQRKALSTGNEAFPKVFARRRLPLDRSPCAVGSAMRERLIARRPRNGKRGNGPLPASRVPFTGHERHCPWGMDPGRQAMASGGWGKFFDN